VFVIGELQDSDGNTLSSGNGAFYDADQMPLSSAGGPSAFGLVEIGKFVPTEVDNTGTPVQVDNTDRANRAVTFIRAQLNFRPSQFLFS